MNNLDIPSNIVIKDGLDRIDLGSYSIFVKKESLLESEVLGFKVKYVAIALLLLAWLKK